MSRAREASISRALPPSRTAEPYGGSRARPVSATKPSSRPSRRYCKSRSRVLTSAASASTPCGARFASDRFNTDHRPSTGFKICVRGEVVHGQPGPGGDQLLHRRVTVVRVVIPDQDNVGAAELLVRGIDHPGQVALAEALLLGLAPVVREHPVDQAGAAPGPHRDHPGQIHAAPALSRDPDLRGSSAPGPGMGLAGAQRAPGLVLEHDPGVQPGGSSFISGQASFTQVVTLSSSRSTATCCGTCGDQPILCSR